MRQHLNRGRGPLGLMLLAAALASCTTEDDTGPIATVHQALLCQSVDVCDDQNPCTDDLCVANLCVNVPLLNCCEQCGGEGGGGMAGVSGGGGGPAGASATDSGGAGTTNAGQGSAGSESAVSGQGGADDLSSGAATVAGEAGTAPSAGGSSVDEPGGAGASDDAVTPDSRILQGGGCSLSRAPGRTIELLAALLLAACATLRPRRRRARKSPQ